MFSGFQSTMAQNNAFQIILSPGELNGWMGGPMDRGSYSTPWDKLREQRYQERIRADREALKKVEQDLLDKERKEQELKARQLRAEKIEAQKLALLEEQMLLEIRRLRIERASLIQRINEAESVLIMMMALRRRLRVV